VFCFGIQKDSRPKRDSVTNVTSYYQCYQCYQSYKSHKSQDPFPRFKTHFQDPRRPNGMVKLLPIPSLKKVRITKTKTPTKKWPRPQDSPRNLLYNQDMMLQNAHGPVPLLPATFATVATVAFRKEMISWLCTSIANCQSLRNQAKRKRELFSPRKSQGKEL